MRQSGLTPPSLSQDMLRRPLFACTAILFTSAFVACQTNDTITFVNPTDRALFVQINERTPFEVAAGTRVTTTLPSLERLQPLAVTARNARGDTVFFVATSLTRLNAQGGQLEMVPNGISVDPFAGAGPLPFLAPTAQPENAGPLRPQ